MKYNGEGNLLWEQRYNGTGNGFDFPSSISLDKSNNVYLCGNSTGSSGNLDMVTIKFSQSTGISTIGQNIPASFMLKQNFPNPFNPQTTIQFSINESTSAAMKIYNSIGIEVETIFIGNIRAGIYETSWNAENFPGGIYYCTLYADNFSETIKMLLVK